MLLSFTVSAKKFQIDTNIESEDGCAWQVSGYVDIGFGGLNGYDITITGPCGTHHFVGIKDPDNGGGSDSPHVYAYRYRSEVISESTEPLNEADKEEIHKNIFMYYTENADLFPTE